MSLCAECVNWVGLIWGWLSWINAAIPMQGWLGIGWFFFFVWAALRCFTDWYTRYDDQGR